MSQKPHLDDFFAAARREEPVITHDEIGELVHARHTKPTLTQHITLKGIGMTTVGFGLAAVLSYFAFIAPGDPSPSQATLTPSVTQTQPTEQAPEVQTLVTPKVEPVRTVEPVAAVAPAPPEPPVPPVSPVRVEAPIKVDKVRIVEPSQSDMKRLGMKVDGGREVVVVQKVGKKFFVVNFAASPFRVASQLESENPTDIEPSEILPVFVTNLDGTGILTAMAPNENTSILTKEVHTSSDNGNAKARTVEHTRTNVTINTDAGDEEDTDQQISIDHQMEMPAFVIDDADLNYAFDDSSVIAAFANAGHASGNSKIHVKRGHPDMDINVDVDVDADGINAHVKDQLNKEIRIKIDGDSGAINIRGLDSLHKKIVVAHVNMDSAMFQMHDLNKEMELVHENIAAAMKNFKIKVNDSTVRIDMQKMMEQLRGAKLDLDDAKKQLMVAKPKIMKMHKQAFVVPGFNDLKAKVNELVPMRVALNTDKGSGLIFWYEPNNAPAVPSQEPQSVSNSSIESLSINPNPAQSHATVRVTMKDAHAVTVSIHDILGKRLLEAGQVNATAAGEFIHELDLSTLSQGMYLVVLTADNGEQRIERILVNK